MDLHKKRQLPVLTNRQALILSHLLDYVFANIQASLPMNVVGQMKYDITVEEVENLKFIFSSCIYLQNNIATFDPSMPRPYCMTGNQALFLYHLMKKVFELAEASMPLNLLVTINTSFGTDEKVNKQEICEIVTVFKKEYYF